MPTGPASAAIPAARALPVVVIPVSVDERALDACLAALEVSTPAGTPVWLADDALGGPRVRSVVDAWLSRTRLQAEYSRRPRPLGEAAHLSDVLAACGDADVAVLACDARPAPGWLSRMARCLDELPHAATVTPWCNAGEAAAWPRSGDIACIPDDLARMAEVFAEAALPAADLPAPVGHAVLIRGELRRAVRGVDAESFASWYAALVDLGLRMQAFGGRNLLCMQAYVARESEARPADGDIDALAARWPHWNAAQAQALMRDPFDAERAQLAQAFARHDAGVMRQAELFASSSP